VAGETTHVFPVGAQPKEARSECRPKACSRKIASSPPDSSALEGGPKQAPVVLLLHSAFSDAAFSWSPIWEELAATHRVIAPDMPGFGASQAPDG
jgi:pimeloyl-ACP methyl ester carboxylesterase